MTTFILLVFVHVGAMGSGNSNALTTVPGFITEAECKAAGAAYAALAKGTVKEIKTVCVKQSRP